MPADFPLDDAQVHCTLASIAYAGDTLNDADPSLDQLHAAISHELNCKPGYATGADWRLVWGPVETAWTDNLLYAAMNAGTGTLALSIRGTTTQALSRFEDVPRYQTGFPDPKGPALVSGPFLDGLKRILKAEDKWHGKTIGAFLKDHGSAFGIKRIVVNGHSQGAALVPMMVVALQEGVLGAPKCAFPVSGFSFAPPTSGNAAFAAHVDKTCDCWFVINPKDVVPLGYDAMMDVVTKGIPEDLPWYEEDTIKTLIDGLNALTTPTDWAQPKQQALLQGITELDGGFFQQIEDQHNHNSYLTRMGAVGTDVGDPSAFGIAKDPVITLPNG